MNIKTNLNTVIPAIPAEIRAWLATERRLLIDGKWVTSLSRKTFEVTDPATGDISLRASHVSEVAREGGVARVDIGQDGGAAVKDRHFADRTIAKLPTCSTWG